MLASAFYRVSMYEAAYGYTALRVYVQAYEVGVGLTLVLLAAEVAGVAGGGGFDGRRAARRSAIVAALMLAAFSFGNPEGWVAARNIARYQLTGKLDGYYLANDLSLNAVPVLTSSLGALPPACMPEMRVLIAQRWGWRSTQPRPWFEWNWRRERGFAAVRAAGLETVHSTGPAKNAPCSVVP